MTNNYLDLLLECGHIHSRAQVMKYAYHSETKCIFIASTSSQVYNRVVSKVTK